jgi:hypothetical protein
MKFNAYVALLLMLACSGLAWAVEGKGEEAANREKASQERLFNSRIALCLYVQARENENPTELGVTPAPKPLVIPPCYAWWVMPLGSVDMPAIRREIREQKIPGLCLYAEKQADLPDLKDLGPIETLVLRGHGVTDAALADLKGLKTLKRLSLEATDVTGAGLASLAGQEGLSSLSLSNSRVTDSGMAPLKALAALETLDLRCCTQITNAGIANIKCLASLRSLDLSYTQVTDAGLGSLKELKALQTLDLGGTKVTDQGAADLAKALPGLKITR